MTEIIMSNNKWFVHESDTFTSFYFIRLTHLPLLWYHWTGSILIVDSTFVKDRHQNLPVLHISCNDIISYFISYYDVALAVLFICFL